MPIRLLAAMAARLQVLWLVALAGWAAPAGAQEAGGAAPDGMPREPLVGRLGGRAEWSVRFSYQFGDGWERSDRWEQADEAPEASMLSVVEVAKDGQQQTYRMVSRWTGGERVEEWIVAGQHVGERPDGSGYYLVGGENLGGRQLVRDDFPELAWLERGHFRGRSTYKGRPVFVFSVPFNERRLTGDQAVLLAQARRENPKVTAEELFVPKVREVVVYLDVATQLPVLYNDGSAIRRYTYKQQAGEPLRAPAAVLAFLAERDKALRARLTRPAGPGSP